MNGLNGFRSLPCTPVLATTCGFQDQAASETDAGFSLVEVVTNLFVVSLLCALVIQCFVSMWMGESALLRYTEDESTWRNISRTLSHDVHSAVASEAKGNVLNLTLVDGTHYRYYLNGRRQLIRDREGGGTSVLGVNVADFSCSQDPVMVRVTVHVSSLLSKTLYMDTLSVMTR
jgi:hypothetical protein